MTGVAAFTAPALAFCSLDEIVHEAPERFPVGEVMVTLDVCRAAASEDNMADDLLLEVVVLVIAERTRGQMRCSWLPARGFQQMAHIRTCLGLTGIESSRQTYGDEG